jgi:hypothetical protein
VHSLKTSTPTGSTKNVQHWRRCIELGRLREKWGMKRSTHSEQYFPLFLSFHFDTLSGCKCIDMEVLLFEHPTN